MMEWLRRLPNIPSILFIAVARILAAEYALGFAVWYFLADGLKDLSGTPLGADFLSVYAAGKMVWDKQASLVYDWAAHGKAEQAVVQYASPYISWHYPPLFLFIAACVALFPYLWAFALYMAAGFSGYWVVLRRIAGYSRAAFWGLLAFPGLFINIGNGQNGFITTALLGGGLLLLENNALGAGALFGLLSYKPQFFVVIPIVLLFGRSYRAFVATIISACLSIGISFVVFGEATWRAFFQNADLVQRVVLEQGITGWQKIQSVFSGVRMLGGTVFCAYLVQAVAACAAIGCAIFVWRRGTSFADRAAVLCGAILLTTPYLLDYDLVILAVPLAYLARQGMERGFRSYEKLLLVLLWLWPFLARSIGSWHLPLTPVLLAAMMEMCCLFSKKDKTEFK